MFNEKFRKHTADKPPEENAPPEELREINASGTKEAQEAVKRLGDFANAQKVIEEFMGYGIAYDMPLGQVIGFLDAQEEKSVKNDGSHGSLRSIGETKDLLISLLDEENFSERSYLLDVLRYFESEMGKLLNVAEAGF